MTASFNPTTMVVDKHTGRVRHKDMRLSRIMKQAMRHLVGKVRPRAAVKAARLGLLHVLRTGKTMFGRKSKLGKHASPGVAEPTKGRKGRAAHPKAKGRARCSKGFTGIRRGV